MTFQKKYYYSFRDKLNDQYTVEIWQDTEISITAEEITGDLNPFSIEYPVSKLFESIKGSGCELNLLSTSDRKFFSLYTANMMEYQIRLYKGGNLIWCGYLDSELYNEPFNVTKNYTVNFTGSDGFSLLNRLYYLDADGNKYTGLITQWTALNNILSKLNLPYTAIYVGISTTSNDFTVGANETIFHQTYCNNQNWYNEDGEAETLRKVLENILNVYGAIIIQDNGSLFITDINTIAGATNTSFKKYDTSFNYVSTESINLNIGDLGTIKFAASDQKMNVKSGYNRQVVKYSPYIDPVIIDFKAEEDFSTVNSTTTYGTNPYQWTETTYNNSVTWNKSGNGSFASYIGLQEANIDKTDSYLRINNYAGYGAIPANLSFSIKKELPYFIPSTCKLKIACKINIRTVDDLDGQNTTDLVYFIRLRTRLKIGNKQLYHNWETVSGYDSYGYYYENYNLINEWVSIEDSRCCTLEFAEISIIKSGSIYQPQKQKLDNKWVDLNLNTIIGKQETLAVKLTPFLVPLSGFEGGEMTFEIYDLDIEDTNHNSVEASIKDIRLKDIVFTVVDANGNELNQSDVEYIGYMNQKYKNESDEIIIFQGTSKVDNSIEKAALLGYNTEYYFLKNWTREGKTDNIENLLLRSLISNYTDKRIELSASINLVNTVLGCLKYQEFLPDKNLIITGIIQNFSENTSSVTLQEVVKDNLEINKSW